MRLVKSEYILCHADVKHYQQRFIKIIVASIAFCLDQPETLIHEREFNALWGRIAPQLALDDLYPKTLSEVLVLGSFIASQEDAMVRLNVGKIDKTLQVFPQRYWYPAARFNEFRAYAPEAQFHDVSIDWQSAYGGEGYPLNPLGQGFVRSKAMLYDERARMPLPLVENPRYLLKSPFPTSDEVFPGTFAPLTLLHPLRWRYVNQHSWARTYPKIPDDIDVLYFQQALSDQCQVDAFMPGMPFSIAGMSATGFIESYLPHLKVRIFAEDQVRSLQELATRLDTLWFLPNDNIGVMSFRAQLPVSDWNANDLKTLMLSVDQVDSGRDLCFYQDVFAKMQGVDAHVYRAANYGLDVTVDDVKKDVLDSVQQAQEARRKFHQGMRKLAAQATSVSILPSQEQSDFLCKSEVIKGQDFSHYDLRGMNFAGKIFEDVNFSDAHLSHVDFTGARLCGVKFIGTQLLGAQFRQAHLERVQFIDSVLEAVDFRFAYFKENVFNQCLLLNVKLTHAFFEVSQFFKGVWQQVDAANLILKKCIFNEVQCRQVNFAYAQLSQLSGYQCSFHQVDFHFIQSQRCGFLGMKTLFEQCCFQKGIWAHVNFLQAQFDGCQFQHMQFVQSEWLSVQLQRSSFVNCDLKENGFCDAVLQQIQFERSCLDGILWQGANLIQVQCDGVLVGDHDFAMARVITL